MKRSAPRPKPRKIDLQEWSRLFREFGWDTIKRYKYYGDDERGAYLAPPATFMVHGMRELRRLRFDNSLAALRMWSFVLSETERLFRARQIGKKIVLTMGDLGTIPVLVTAFPDCIPFCPESISWIPFLKDSAELFDTASRLGAPEAAGHVRAVLAAFHKKAYFPPPDLVIASTGASCDDHSCVMQLIEDLVQNMLWVEIPYRRETVDSQITSAKTKSGISYQREMEEYLTAEYRRIWQELFKVTGVNNPHRLEESIRKANRLRRLVSEIKNLVYDAGSTPLPALEMMMIEFGNLHGYADFDEWLDILAMVRQTIKDRIARGNGVLAKAAVPIAWINPPADPLLMNLVESSGCRVVATEYAINQALVEVEEDIEPLLALARSFINASLIGSTAERVRSIKEKITGKKIRGVIVANIPDDPRCSMETKLIEKMLGEVPILALDVPPPSGITEQIRTSIKAFVETIK